MRGGDSDIVCVAVMSVEEVVYQYFAHSFSLYIKIQKEVSISFESPQHELTVGLWRNTC